MVCPSSDPKMGIKPVVISEPSFAKTEVQLSSTPRYGSLKLRSTAPLEFISETMALGHTNFDQEFKWGCAPVRLSANLSKHHNFLGP